MNSDENTNWMIARIRQYSAAEIPCRERSLKHVAHVADEMAYSVMKKMAFNLFCFKVVFASSVGLFIFSVIISSLIFTD
jgi:hypothetical protein